jgi:diguanylate cyclase (GGDEF)-like protein
MRKSLRNIDIITRTGDDEFVILLPETALDDALSVAQRISKNLRNLSLKGTAGTNIRISVSGTVLCFDDYESPDTDVVKVAGQILLHGKKVNIGTLKLREVHYAAVCNN